MEPRSGVPVSTVADVVVVGEGVRGGRRKLESALTDRRRRDGRLAHSQLVDAGSGQAGGTGGTLVFVVYGGAVRVRREDRIEEFHGRFGRLFAHDVGPLLRLAVLHDFGFVQFTRPPVGRLPGHHLLPGARLHALVAGALPVAAIPFVALERHFEAVVLAAGAVGRGARIEGAGGAAAAVVDRRTGTGGGQRDRAGRHTVAVLLAEGALVYHAAARGRLAPAAAANVWVAPFGRALPASVGRRATSAHTSSTLG